MDPRIATQAAGPAATAARMRAKEAAGEPRLAVFWFVPGGDGPQLLEIATPVSECPLEADAFRNQRMGHDEAWKVFQRAVPELRAVPYEAYPRGRVTFLSEGAGRYNLLVDPQIRAAPALMALLFETFHLPRDRTAVMLDAHYVATRKLPGARPPDAFGGPA